MSYVVKKVINNNILCVSDASGCELIVSGRGIGFGRKAGETVEEDTIQKVYRMTSPSVQRKLADLMEHIPYEHLALTDELVRMISGRLPYPLNESLLITLADHISFAIERKQNGVSFKNPLMQPIRDYYPAEYQLGRDCLERIEQQLGVALSKDEAGFIALHIVNAELNTSMSIMNDITQFVDGCIQVIEYYYHKTYDRESLDFSRLAVHMRFFAQRVFQGTEPTDNLAHDEMFRTLIARNCPEHYRCAECVAAYAENTWHKKMSDEELIFLTIHLKRINPDGQEIE